MWVHGYFFLLSHTYLSPLAWGSKSTIILYVKELFCNFIL